MKSEVVKLFMTCLLFSGVATGKEQAAGKSSFRYCGGWRGQHTDSKRIGLGTAELIAPSWAITAAHVARAKAQTPNKRNVLINFGPDKSARVKKAFLSPKGDLALVQFHQPVKGVKLVSLLNRPLTKKNGVVKFTLVGSAGGLHFHRNRRAKGTGLHARHITKKADNPGKAGDSGGGWVIEDKVSNKHILFGIIHGGRRGTQPAAVRTWINNTMKASGEKANWAPLPKPPQKKK